MTNKEAIEKLEWVYQNGFDNDFEKDGVEHTLDALRKGIEALEKQVPQKPLHSGVEYDCPRCLGTVGHITTRGRLVLVADHHCKCGQAIDWGEE